MVQGGKFKPSSGKKGAPPPKKGHSVKQRAKNASKHYAFKMFKPAGGKALEAFEANKTVEKTINANIEKLMAGKVIQAGEKLSLSDVKARGKDHVKEMKRGILKKKKTGIEEKMLKLKEKLDKEESKYESKSAAAKPQGLLTEEVISRA